MSRMAKKYPQVVAMVCSGGAGRVDYGALKYFHSLLAERQYVVVDPKNWTVKRWSRV